MESSSALLDRKLIRLPHDYLESKFNMTGVISYNLALMIEFCLIIADFLSLLLTGCLLEWGGVAFLIGWVFICWLRFWLLDILLVILSLASLIRGFSIFDIDLDRLLLDIDRLLPIGFWFDELFHFFTLKLFSLSSGSLSFNLETVKFLITASTFYSSAFVILYTKSYADCTFCLCFIKSDANTWNLAVNSFLSTFA